MPLTRSRQLLLLFAPVLLLAAAWWHRGLAPAAAGRDHDAAGAEMAPVVAVVVPPPRRMLAERAAPVLPGLPLNRRAGFEAEPDLYRYAQQLAVAARDGDAEANWMLSRVYDYCAAYAQDPAGFAADNTALTAQASPGVVSMLDARQRLQSRCAGFVARDGLSAATILAQRTQAAQAGNLAAEAALLALGRPLQNTLAYKRGLVERVLASRDPEAYLSLSTAMGASARGDAAFDGYIAGDQFSQLAWQLAACQLGLACGPQSNLMTSYCANGGICSTDASQDFPSFVLDAAVPRQGAKKMDEMVSTLVAGSGVSS